MLERFTVGDPPETIFAALERDGGVVVHDFAAPDLVGALAADYRRALDPEPWGNTDSGLPDEFFGRKTKRLHGLLAHSKHFADVLVHPLASGLCDHVLAPRTREYRLSTGELMAIGPGESRQDLHRDADSWRYFPQPRPEILVSVNLALTDFHEANGATVVVPGSHRWPAERRPTDTDAVAFAEMPRGSALLYTGNVWHGGGANRTEATRVGLYWGYLLSWLAPLEQHWVTNGREAIQAAPEPVQRLLGVSPDGWHVFP